MQQNTGTDYTVRDGELHDEDTANSNFQTQKEEEHAIEDEDPDDYEDIDDDEGTGEAENEGQAGDEYEDEGDNERGGENHSLNDNPTQPTQAQQAESNQDPDPSEILSRLKAQAPKRKNIFLPQKPLKRIRLIHRPHRKGIQIHQLLRNKNIKRPKKKVTWETPLEKVKVFGRRDQIGVKRQDEDKDDGATSGNKVEAFDYSDSMCFGRSGESDERQ